MDSTPRELKDVDLWARSLRGDGHAFAHLFDRHRDRVFRSVLRLAATTHEAEDVVAATFLELWRLRDRVRIVDDSVLPWLLVTAFNVARNSARSRRRYERLLATIPIPRESKNLDCIAALEAERAAVDALRALPKADAEILILVGIEGLTLAESARALDISVDAAKQRLSRARRRAREHLGHPNGDLHPAEPPRTQPRQAVTGRSAP